MMDNLARRRYTVRMELQIERKPDGFAGETYIVLPTEAFSDYIGHPLVRRLYLTDAGFFPHAAHHYRERSEGIEEYIFLCCTSGRGVVEVQGRTFPLRDNEALCIPRLCPHRYWADEEDPWSLLWVHFQGEDCGYYPLDRPQVCRFSSAGTVRRMEFLFNQLFRTLEQDYTLGNFIYLSQLLALILGETYARRQEDGTTRSVRIRKGEGEDLGPEFDTYLMDRARSCANNCIFCFVDQMPQGMRDTLYFKDDDARLSFLMGNYITLTNLSRRELQRICDLHISPINISVHATDPAVRRLLLGNQRRGGECLEIMEQFARAGIVMNCQIVACPGLNDGGVLQRSMEDLAALYPQVKSVSVVPVGLTRYRKGLYPLRPYTVDEAREVVGQVEAYGARCLGEKGSRIFWCSDEFYLQGELPLPEDAFYEAYTQLENGVGMLRLLEVELNGAALGAPQNIPVAPFSIATGVAAAPFLREIIDRAAAKCHTKLDYQIYPIVNHFFGETITVAGLLTGQDLLAQLRGKDLGTRVLLPQNTLRHGETVFLDDMTLEELSQGLGVPVVPVNQDGFDLFEAVFGV